jgi:hypothetical protein
MVTGWTARAAVVVAAGTGVTDDGNARKDPGLSWAKRVLAPVKKSSAVAPSGALKSAGLTG